MGEGSTQPTAICPWLPGTGPAGSMTAVDYLLAPRDSCGDCRPGTGTRPIPTRLHPPGALRAARWQPGRTGAQSGRVDLPGVAVTSGGGDRKRCGDGAC